MLEAELLERGCEFAALAAGDLEAAQDAAEAGAVVSVVEQGDVPAAAERGQELEQGAGALGELEV